MSEKIQPSHIEREACVYIRQSTMQQVRTRLEGQRRQYDLRERAKLLGFQRVVVIDEDQGRSGTGSVERPGFGRLLAAVCSGNVGAVLAFEASRLARNNRDWHHLIDLCAMAGTLVIDHDGIYDPSLLNVVVRRLIAQKSLPAKQIVKFAPWMIERSHLDLPSVRKDIRRVHEGRRTRWAVTEKQTGLFADSHEA